jgi:hypothetical protein
MPGRVEILLVGCWSALLAGLLIAPSVLSSSNPGDDLIRNTVRLALLFYLLAAVLMLSLDSPGWRAAPPLISSRPGRIARWCWVLAWLAYLIHVAVAFHFAHHWSHQEAMRHVEKVSGFGPGIFVSYLFTLVWTIDVLWWLWRPGDYAHRPLLINRTLHGFMAFIIFNATVVYESGVIRWLGIGLFVVLGWRLWRRRPIHALGETS